MGTNTSRTSRHSHLASLLLSVGACYVWGWAFKVCSNHGHRITFLCISYPNKLQTYFDYYRTCLLAIIYSPACRSHCSRSEIDGRRMKILPFCTIRQLWNPDPIHLYKQNTGRVSFTQDPKLIVNEVSIYPKKDECFFYLLLVLYNAAHIALSCE